jgi:N-acetyl-gamma-glutamyl-phosphate reductase
MEIIQAYADSGKKLIDLSADLRFDDLAAYEKCYGVKHIDQALNGKFIYGLPEINRSQVQKTNFLANPGCYPTSVILAIAPVLKNGLIEPTGIICDSKTGVTGAGRKAALGFLFPEVSETLKAYKVDQHPHAPEIDQELTKLAGTAARVTFVPHLVPLNRGILSTIYCRLAKPVSTGQVLKVYQEMYGAEPFVRVKGEGQYPEVQEVLHSNYCDIGLKVDQTGETLMVVSVIDNLLKGASGQAVQNMNIMCGFKETAGLL